MKLGMLSLWSAAPSTTLGTAGLVVRSEPSVEANVTDTKPTTKVKGRKPSAKFERAQRDRELHFG